MVASSRFRGRRGNAVQHVDLIHVVHIGHSLQLVQLGVAISNFRKRRMGHIGRTESGLVENALIRECIHASYILLAYATNASSMVWSYNNISMRTSSLLSRIRG